MRRHPSAAPAALRRTASLAARSGGRRRPSAVAVEPVRAAARTRLRRGGGLGRSGWGTGEGERRITGRDSEGLGRVDGWVGGGTAHDQHTIRKSKNRFGRYAGTPERGRPDAVREGAATAKNRSSDAIQRAFVSALRGARSGRPSGNGSFERYFSWLFRTAFILALLTFNILAGMFKAC